MLKIAICDDEKKSVLLIESLTKQIFQEEKIPAQITTYGNGDFLLYDIQEKKCYDIILLDIVDRDGQMIHYVYVQCTEKKEIGFEHKLLPKDYPELKDMEINTYD